MTSSRDPRVARDRREQISATRRLPLFLGVHKSWLAAHHDYRIEQRPTVMSVATIEINDGIITHEIASKLIYRLVEDLLFLKGQIALYVSVFRVTRISEEIIITFRPVAHLSKLSEREKVRLTRRSGRMTRNLMEARRFLRRLTRNGLRYSMSWICCLLICPPPFLLCRLP